MLSPALVKLLFPSDTASSLCGVSMGDPVSSLTLPAWWSDTLTAGKRVGWLELGDSGISRAFCEAEETLGKTSTVRATLYPDPCPNDFPNPIERALYDDLNALLTKRLGKRKSKEKKMTCWDVPGPLAGELLLQLDAGHQSRVWITLKLASGVQIEAEPTEASGDFETTLAGVLASAAWPAARCKEVIARYFARESDMAADAADKKDLAEILDAAKGERPAELRAMLRRILGLIDLGDLASGAPRACHVLAQVASRSHMWKGRWLLLNINDLVQLLKVLDVPAEERAGWAFDLACALEWGDEEATRKITARMATLPAPDPIGAHAAIAYDSSDEVEGRTFALATAALPDDPARIRFVLRPGSNFGSNCVRAAASYLVSRGAPAPSLASPLDARGSAGDWARLIAVVRRGLPALADEVVEAAAKANDGSARTMRALCDAFADESDVGEKSRWRIGAVVVQHSGKPTAGRWTHQRLDDEEAAKEVFAGRKPAKKGAAKKA